MLSRRTRSVASSSVPEVWTCSSCRAKSQRQRRYQHNEAEAQRSIIGHGDGTNSTALGTGSEGALYVQGTTRNVHKRSSVWRSSIPQKSDTKPLTSRQYGCKVEDVSNQPTVSQTPGAGVSQVRTQFPTDHGYLAHYRHEQADEEARQRTNATQKSNITDYRLQNRVRESPGQSSSQVVQLCRRTGQAHVVQLYSWPALAKQHQVGRPRSQIPRMYSTVTTAEISTAAEVPPLALDSNHLEAKQEADTSRNIGIRDQLRKWQELNGDKLCPEDIKPQEKAAEEGLVNMFSHLPDEAALPDNKRESDEHEAAAHFAQISAEDAGDDVRITQHLIMGDLVEFEASSTDSVSTVAVFVRKLDVGHKLGGDLCQFLTVSGRWLHNREKAIMFSIPQFLPRDIIEPVVPYLPNEVDAEDLAALAEEAKLNDLGVPRDLSAPIVRELQAFTAEAKEIYRKHASRLDDAHHILAHPTDLRYGSLKTAASTLLRLPSHALTPPALFAVRQALIHAGFAFEIDRRSHRKTGYLQIRSTEQVAMVENVRDWMRDWQEDQSLSVTMNEWELTQHTPSRGARIIHNFLKKAKRIVLENRKSRQATVCNNVGPSNKKFAATVTSDCVQIETTMEFGPEEVQILKFMEIWGVTQQLRGYGRITALPPLLLQATGLYGPEWRLSQKTGFQFLQELGTILPYENRVRFDQHLLLPSSQHSKPLQSLMTTLLDMRSRPDFEDSMNGLRKDWKNTPVYCIDGADAKEIDDGISLEVADKDIDGIDTYWIHVHIANPTAFFSRDHPLAKMARHMGETIYMPERTYMMLPRWATQRHFSLANNRPCLTFSVRLDHKGRKLEHKIEPGTIRNVISLAVDEVSTFLEGEVVNRLSRNIRLTVGGDPPPQKTRLSSMASLTAEQKDQLRTLHRLAGERTEIRRQQGGFFFQAPSADVSVWQNHKGEGLAWDNPYRKGRRTVYGDPGIQVRTTSFSNMFQEATLAGENTVRECMLLAGEVAANWCAERQIPGVFRGSVNRPNEEHDQERMLKEKLEPLWQSGGYPRGQFPMHLGLQYLRTFGETHLSTRPFRHRVLGMEAYGKVTSPLRRYGDMIMHWQIEAALREEARQGRSIATQDPNEPRLFLPFSAPVLDNIFVGLQPREILILRSSVNSQLHWAMLLLMRAHHYNEIPLPLEKPGYMKVYIQATNQFLKSQWWLAPGKSMELNLPCNVLSTLDGVTQGPFRQGDIWEVRIREIDVFLRSVIAEPVRLLERAD